MYNLKFFFNKDLIYFVFFHLLTSELSFYLWLMLYVCFISDENFNIFIMMSIPYIVLKFFGMIIYYKVFYKRVRNPLVIKLMKILRQDKKYSRCIMLIIVSLYQLLTLNFCIFSWSWLYKFLVGILWGSISSSFLSYKFLFYYWDIYDYIQKEPRIYKYLIFALKKIGLFLFISVVLILLTIKLRPPGGFS